MDVGAKVEDRKQPQRTDEDAARTGDDPFYGILRGSDNRHEDQAGVVCRATGEYELASGAILGGRTESCGGWLAPSNDPGLEKPLYKRHGGEYYVDPLFKRIYMWN